MFRKLAAEFIGTFWLVFGGTGAAVLAAAFPGVGIGLLGVALAFGLTLMTAAYAIGRISGCHINPSVTVGFAVSGKFPWKDVPPYIIAQVLGAIVGSGVVYAIASGAPGFSISGGLAANGYGAHSPGHYSMVSGLIAEIVLTFIFVFVILGTVESRLLEGFAPIAIGLCLTAVHLVGIPVTNMSVNPARSTGPAVYVGDWAIAQLWFFWLFPLIGAIIAGLLHRVIGPDQGMVEEV